MKDDMLAIGKIHTFLKRVGLVAIKTVKQIMVLTLYYLNYGGAELKRDISWKVFVDEKVPEMLSNLCWCLICPNRNGTYCIVFVNPVADFSSFSITLSSSVSIDMGMTVLSKRTM